MADITAKSIRAELMPGYEPLDEFGKPETAGERKLIFYDSSGRFINHRHTPCIIPKLFQRVEQAAVVEPVTRRLDDYHTIQPQSCL